MGGGSFVRPAGVASPLHGGGDGGGGSGAGMEMGGSVLEQRQMMVEQDLLVDEIGAGVDRLHTRALNIRDESKLHVSLLNDMDHDVDHALVGLRAETAHAMQIRKTTGNCHLYICILVLLVTLVMLLAISYS